MNDDLSPNSCGDRIDPVEHWRLPTESKRIAASPDDGMLQSFGFEWVSPTAALDLNDSDPSSKEHMK